MTTHTASRACWPALHNPQSAEETVPVVANHISCRVPGADRQFLVNPYGMRYEEITASSLIKIDLAGRILFHATDYGINGAGFVIHRAIHGARHDVDCISTPIRRRAWQSRHGIRVAADRPIADAFPARRLPRLRRHRR